MRILSRVAIRLLWALPMLWIVTFLSFLLVSFAPGDAATTILGANASPEQVQLLRDQMGLDRPLFVRYGSWLADALQGDLGTSLITGAPVTTYLTSSLGPTISLVLLAVIVSAAVGMGLGVLSAVRGGWKGRALDILSFAGLAVPSYWLALVLISVFADGLQWLPAVGYVAFGDSPSEWARSLILPVCAASLMGTAAVAKQTRDSMLDTLNRDFIRVMQANGLPRRSIVYRHALRNAAIPVVTILGVVAVALLSAVVFVEMIFALPGLGSAATTAATQSDLPVLQGAVVFFTLVVIVINVAVDLSYTFLDPRVGDR